MMRTLGGKLLGTAVAWVISASCWSASANEFANPGFEDPVTTEGTVFVDSWEAFSSDGPQSISDNSTTMPRSGAQALELVIDNAADQFAGAFQDVDELIAGQEVTFSGWHALASGDPGGTEFRIEWRDSVADIEIERTPNLAPTAGAAYESFSLTDIVPAGADTARAVYAIQSFGGVLEQQMFVDDMSFTVVPEPASIVLCGVAALAVWAGRRQGRIC